MPELPLAKSVPIQSESASHRPQSQREDSIKEEKEDGSIHVFEQGPEAGKAGSWDTYPLLPLQ